MDAPTCNCFKKEAEGRGERIAGGIAQDVSQDFFSMLRHDGVCHPAMMHMTLTLLVVVLDAVAFYSCPEKIELEDQKAFSEAAFEKQMSTLVADLRQRRAEIEANIERAEGTTVQ
jgi:hypothetical protein